MAKLIEDDNREPLFEDNAIKIGILYIKDILLLSRKELNKYINIYEAYFTITIKRFRGDIVRLATFI